MAQVHKPCGQGGSAMILFSEQHILEASETMQHPIGSVLMTRNGVFRYARAGEALVPGDILTALALRNYEVSITVAASVGDTTLTITNGTGSEVAKDAYADGLIVLQTTSGGVIKGEYDIKGNTLAANSATMTVTLYDQVHTALLTSDDATMVTSPYNLVQIANAETEAPVGTSRIGVTTQYYFWMQVRGLCALRAEDANLGDAADERALCMANSDPTEFAKATAGTVHVGHILGDTSVTTADDAEVVFMVLD